MSLKHPKYKLVDKRPKDVSPEMDKLMRESMQTFFERQAEVDPLYRKRITFPRLRNLYYFLIPKDYIGSLEDHFERWSDAKSRTYNPLWTKECSDEDIAKTEIMFIKNLADVIISNSIALKFLCYTGISIVLLLIAIIAILVF